MQSLERLAELVHQRSAIESEIAHILGRPATHGHLGEYVASQIFGIESRGAIRPWCISSVFLFESAELLASLRQRGVKIGIATSVASEYWRTAEIFPGRTSPHLTLTDDERRLLELFAPSPA